MTRFVHCLAYLQVESVQHLLSCVTAQSLAPSAVAEDDAADSLVISQHQE